jgi:hypothetical protein
MFFIGGVVFSHHLRPFAVVREERIGLGGYIVYLCQAEPVGLIQ